MIVTLGAEDAGATFGPWPVALSIALLALNGFFVASEFALLAARRARLEAVAAEGSGAARQAVVSLRELTLMLAGAQLGITMASLGLGAVAEPAVAAGLEQLLAGVALPSGVRHAIAFAIALALVVFLHMVVGEMAPKSWAIADPERSTLLLIRPFRAFTVVFRPFLLFLNATANGVVRLLGVEPQDERAQVHSPSDLLLLVEQSAQHGELARDEHGLFARALDLSGLDAEAVMVPRRDVVAAPSTMSVDELEALTSTTGRSRFPVYGSDLDDVTGVVHVKDILFLEPSARRTVTAGHLAAPALAVPESVALEDLMLRMQERRQHLALVIDEYGTLSGLVTLEDLLEELIGDFEDESDAPETGGATPRSTSGGDDAKVRSADDGSLLVPGRLRPDELREECGVELPEGPWETVAGYVLRRLSRIPEVGDEVVREPGTGSSGARLVVARMDDNRILEVALQLLEPLGVEESDQEDEDQREDAEH